MSRSRLLLTVVSFVSLLSVIAYTQNAPGAKSEQRITREVRHELLTLPYFGVFDYIAYKVDDDTVTLLGQVVRPSLRSDAENAVKRIEGVDRVENQIEVLPPSPRTTGCAWRCSVPSMGIQYCKDTNWAY